MKRRFCNVKLTEQLLFKTSFSKIENVMMHQTPRGYITMTSLWARWRLKSRHDCLLTAYPGTDKKHQSSTSLAFVRRIHRWIPHTKGQ